jgi:hypothetical protein
MGSVCHFLLSLLLCFFFLQGGSLVQHQQANWDLGLGERTQENKVFQFPMGFFQTLPSVLQSTGDSNLNMKEEVSLEGDEVTEVAQPVVCERGRELYCSPGVFHLTLQFWG